MSDQPAVIEEVAIIEAATGGEALQNEGASSGAASEAAADTASANEASAAGKKRTSKPKKPVGAKGAKAGAGHSQKIGVRNREFGRRGEDAAANYLQRRGYVIVARNWTCLAGEADIIASIDGAIVFVEVKTRKDASMGLPSEAVDARKRKKYEDIAMSFLCSYDARDIQVRFDVISVMQIASDRAFIRHHIDAFGAA